MTAFAATIRELRSFDLLAGASGGASADAARIAQIYLGIFDRFAKSATGNKRLADPLETIADLYRRCRQPNWDRDGAIAISTDAVSDAKAILLALPSHYPVPEIFAEATGSIAFEWYRRSGYRFVVTTSGNSSLEYAGLFGPGNEAYGRARLADGLPEIIQDHLRSLYAE